MDGPREHLREESTDWIGFVDDAIVDNSLRHMSGLLEIRRLQGCRQRGRVCATHGVEARAQESGMSMGEGDAEKPPKTQPKMDGPHKPPQPPAIALSLSGRPSDGRTPSLASLRRARETPDGTVVCPECRQIYSCHPEFHGAIVTCARCQAQFVILKPTPAWLRTIRSWFRRD